MMFSWGRGATFYTASSAFPQEVRQCHGTAGSSLIQKACFLLPGSLTQFHFSLKGIFLEVYD